MESWGVVFLGLIALASLVQAGFLIGLALGGLRLAKRVDELSARLDRDIKPALESLTRVSRGAAEIADLATLQARRVDQLLADTIDKIEETTGVIQQLVVRPLKPLGGILALLRGRAARDGGLPPARRPGRPRAAARPAPAQPRRGR